MRRICINILKQFLKCIISNLTFYIIHVVYLQAIPLDLAFVWFLIYVYSEV